MWNFTARMFRHLTILREHHYPNLAVFQQHSIKKSCVNDKRNSATSTLVTQKRRWVLDVYGETEQAPSHTDCLLPLLHTCDGPDRSQQINLIDNLSFGCEIHWHTRSVTTSRRHLVHQRLVHRPAYRPTNVRKTIIIIERGGTYGPCLQTLDRKKTLNKAKLKRTYPWLWWHQCVRVSPR